MSMEGSPEGAATGGRRTGGRPGVARLRVRAVASLLTVALAAGCASGPPKPTEISGTAQAAANVNPSVSQRPSPLLVRLYELKSATAFSNADFVSLYQGDQAVLGNEMVARDEFVLKPGDTRPINKVVGPETHFLGVFAAYRDLDRAKWRSLLAVQPGQKQRILIRADELTITATAMTGATAAVAAAPAVVGR